MWVRYLVIVWICYAIAWNFALFRKPLRAMKSAAPVPTPRGPQRILVIGATGGTGRQLVEQALAQGHHVTALVRTPAKMQLTHENLRIVRGDVLDYVSVELAMLGQDAVVSALGHTHFLGPSRVLSDGTRNILRAMRSCRVRRFICESSLGVGDAVGRLGLLSTFLFVPLLLSFYFYDRVRQENLIEASGVDWIIVRPTRLTNGAARGSYRHGTQVGNYIFGNSIARADVADFMLKQLHDDTYLGRAVGVV
ncbi:MAG: NAD(P)H-binding protein [Chthoniobacterales bacterium]